MAAQKWEKHTINLVYGSDLDMKFKMSANKSHMVRHVFTRHDQMYAEIQSLLAENQSQREGIAKLQARLSGERTDEDVIREIELDPNQTTFEIEVPKKEDQRCRYHYMKIGGGTVCGQCPECLEGKE